MPEKENRMYMMELYADGHCSVAKIEDGKCYELTIPSETQAIQIPKGHGPIVDMGTFKVNVVEVDTGKVSWEVNQLLEAEEQDDTNNNGESDRDNSSLLPKAPMRTM